MSARKCTAKSKRTGQNCGANAMIGKTVCYHHGGKSPRGAASANFKHGRYSLNLPTRLAGKYEQAKSDPDLLALKEEISLTDVRITELLERIGEDEQKDDGAIWAAVFEAIEQRRRLVESEARRMRELSLYISAESAMLLISAIADIVRQHVHDKQALGAISGDIEKLITIEPTN